MRSIGKRPIGPCTGWQQALFSRHAQIDARCSVESGTCLCVEICICISATLLTSPLSSGALITERSSYMYTLRPLKTTLRNIYPDTSINYLIPTPNRQDAPNLQHALLSRAYGVADPEPAPSVVFDEERTFLRKGQYRYVMQPILRRALPQKTLLNLAGCGVPACQHPHVSHAPEFVQRYGTEGALESRF